MMRKIIPIALLVLLIFGQVLSQKDNDKQKETPPKKDPPVVVAPDKEKKPPKGEQPDNRERESPKKP